MKQFEVIILRMRKQPFKTKFTPYFKLKWGKTFPPAKYPSRPKQEVHTFDIKEYVKSEKKKKLLEMMNSSDESVNKELPPDLRKVQLDNRNNPRLLDSTNKDKPEENIKLPDFLIKNTEENKNHKQMGSGIPSIDEPFSPFNKPRIETEISKPPIPFNRVDDDEDDDDDEEFNFDVDELVKKIDAKIAELEEQERKEKEAEEKERKEEEKKKQQTPPPKSTTNSINDVLNHKEDKQEKIEIINNTQPSVEKEEKKEVINLDLDDDDDDDDFFDDFFDS